MFDAPLYRGYFFQPRCLCQNKFVVIYVTTPCQQKPSLNRHKLMQAYARLAKVANTEFDDYNTNMDIHILGEILRHLTTKILFVALDPIMDFIIISKIVFKHLTSYDFCL